MRGLGGFNSHRYRCLQQNKETQVMNKMNARVIRAVRALAAGAALAAAVPALAQVRWN